MKTRISRRGVLKPAVFLTLAGFFLTQSIPSGLAYDPAAPAPFEAQNQTPVIEASAQPPSAPEPAPVPDTSMEWMGNSTPLNQDAVESLPEAPEVILSAPVEMMISAIITTPEINTEPAVSEPLVSTNLLPDLLTDPLGYAAFMQQGSSTSLSTDTLLTLPGSEWTAESASASLFKAASPGPLDALDPMMEEWVQMEDPGFILVNADEDEPANQIKSEMKATPIKTEFRAFMTIKTISSVYTVNPDVNYIEIVFRDADGKEMGTIDYDFDIPGPVVVNGQVFQPRPNPNVYFKQAPEFYDSVKKEWVQYKVEDLEFVFEKKTGNGEFIYLTIKDKKTGKVLWKEYVGGYYLA